MAVRLTEMEKTVGKAALIIKKIACCGEDERQSLMDALVRTAEAAPELD